MSRSERPEIGPPEDLEHFLHVGVEDIGSGVLERDQHSAFLAVAERRRRRLPRTPRREGTAPEPRVEPKSTPRRRDKDWLRSAVMCVLRDASRELADLLAGNDIMSRDHDQHTLLDIALMTNAIDCILLLRSLDCPEREDYCDPAVRAERLNRIRKQRDIPGDPTPAEISALFATLYDRWNALYIGAGTPPAPSAVRLSPSSSTSLVVTIMTPSEATKTFVSHFKIEWSESPSFTPSHSVFIPSSSTQHTLENLQTGVGYYVRAACCNLRAIGPAIASVPNMLAPSTWREAADGLVRVRQPIRICDERLTHLETTMRQAKLNALNDAPEREKVISSSSLFGSSVKWQKSLKKGALHLAVVFYADDDGLCISNKSTLPIMVLDDSIPVDVTSQLQWLQKVSLDWRLGRAMRATMSDQVAAIEFRKRVLDAIAALQACLDREDIGSLHHELVRDGNASTILAVARVPRGRIQGLTWSTVDAVTKASSAVSDTLTEVAPDRLLAAVQSAISIHRGLRTKLDPGLYLVLIDAESTMADIFAKLLRSNSFLPHVKLRPRAHVSRAEWEFLCSMGEGNHSPTGAMDLLTSIVNELPALFSQANIDPADGATYRFYDGEVVELDRDVAMLLLLPPSGQFLQNASGSVVDTADVIHVPASVVESSLWSLYQPNVFKTYSRLSALLSNEILSLGHAARVALSSAETAAIKESLATANGFQDSLNEAFLPLQWLRTVLRWGRSENPPRTVEMLRHSIRVQPVPAAPARSSGPNDKDKGKMASISVAADLSRHPDKRGTVSITASQMATATEIIESALRKMRIADSPSDCSLAVLEEDGAERTLAEDSHPMLLLVRWKNATFLLKNK